MHNILFDHCDYYSPPANEVPDTLIIGYTRAAPFIITEEKDPFGISIWLWEKVASDLNINYELKEMPFSELLNKLGTGEVHASINPLTIIAERCKKLNFTLPFFAFNSTVAHIKTSGLHKILHIVGSIFSFNFLRVIAGLFILIGAIGFTVWYFERKKNPDQFRPNHKGIWDGLWWSAITMTTVGYGDKSPKSRGGKLIALVWMFSGIIFISGFTGSLLPS